MASVSSFASPSASAAIPREPARDAATHRSRAIRQESRASQPSRGPVATALTGRYALQPVRAPIRRGSSKGNIKRWHSTSRRREKSRPPQPLRFSREWMAMAGRHARSAASRWILVLTSADSAQQRCERHLHRGHHRTSRTPPRVRHARAWPTSVVPTVMHL